MMFHKGTKDINGLKSGATCDTLFTCNGLHRHLYMMVKSSQYLSSSVSGHSVGSVVRVIMTSVNIFPSMRLWGNILLFLNFWSNHRKIFASFVNNWLLYKSLVGGISSKLWPVLLVNNRVDEMKWNKCSWHTKRLQLNPIEETKPWSDCSEFRHALWIFNVDQLCQIWFRSVK